MASRRLTKALKEEIRSSILFAVKKKMAESIPGKELAAIKTKLENFVLKTAFALFTDEEMVVLKKYKHIQNIYDFALDRDGNKNNLYAPWNDGIRRWLTLNFDESIRVPDTIQFNSYGLRGLIKDDTKMCKLAYAGITIFEHVDCEIQATTDAFMEIVNTFTTEAKLVAAHPNMKKHIPDYEEPIKRVVSKKSKSIIKNFDTI